MWKKASIRDQCQSDYFFSKKQPEETEKLLGQGEHLLRWFSKNAIGHNHSAPLLSLLIDLHFRSRKYTHDPSTERIKQQGVIAPNFPEAVLLAQAGYTTETSDIEEVMYALQCMWRTEKYEITEGSLITSDCPVVLFSVNDRISLILWPLTPTLVLVMNEFRHLGNIRQVTTGISFTNSVNHVIAQSCHHSIYSSICRSKEETVELAKSVNKAVLAENSWSHNEGQVTFKPNLLNIEKENYPFYFDVNPNPIGILSYLKAKQLLSSGVVKIDRVNKKSELHGNVSLADLFCVQQLDEVLMRSRDS